MRRYDFELNLKIDKIGGEIKRLRVAKNMTQSDLGKLLGVQKSRISKIENMQGSMSIKEVVRVFNAIGVGIKLHVGESIIDLTYET